MEPFEQNKQQLRAYLKASLIGHAALFLLFGLGSIFAPDTLHLTPAIQIDMVALPDQTKNAETQSVDTALPVKEDEPPPPKEEAKPEKPEPDPMVMEKKKTEDAEKRAKEALAKIRENLKKEQKAEEAKKKETAAKRKQDLKQFEETFRKALKGNQVNQGSSESGQMQATINAYAGHIADRIRDNWDLPVFLQSKDLSARIVIYIGSNGGLLRMQITKSSGNAVFDDKAEAAVRAARFSPPPAELASGLRNSGIEVKFPL